MCHLRAALPAHVVTGKRRGGRRRYTPGLPDTHGLPGRARKAPELLVLAAPGGLRPDTGQVIGAAFEARLAAAQAGDEAAFAIVFRDVQPALLRYLRVAAPEAAEDVAAETWLQVITGLPRFSGGETAFRAWLFTIARHRAVDAGRSRDRRRTVPLERSTATEPLAPDTADVALERITTRAAAALISSLPKDQAEIIMLRVVADLDTHQVARIVGKSPGAVRVAAHRGLRRLAAMMDRAGVL
jgi:RNA polymerase sigma-70 factor (ECF subfamily)